MYCSCGAKIGYNTYNRHGVEYAKPKLVCNNQVHCHSGSVSFEEVLTYVCKSLKDCIEDFKVMIDNNKDDSIKLHQDLVMTLEDKLKKLEQQELEQWKGQYHPDPEQRIPPEIFKQLNQELRQEKEEIKQALCKAQESSPKPVDYKEQIKKFSDALNALKDPNISAKIKNRYLKDIIERIEYNRPPITRINENIKGMRYKREPYKINIELKS